MIRAAIIALMLAGAAHAESLAIIGQSPHHNAQTATHVRLHQPTDPAAVATLSYRNRGTNGPPDNGTYSVEWHGLTVTVEYQWNAEGSADRITVEAPPGFVAVPRSLALPEETAGQVHIIKYRGM